MAGRSLVLTGRTSKNSLEARGPCILRTIQPGAQILIGDDVGISTSTIAAAYRISIGNRVMIGAGCIITDSNHHPLSSPGTRRYMPIPMAKAEDAVEIEDDVFVGARSIILKGVTLGRGCTIGAGSVVTRNIPPGSVAAGNPCTVISSAPVAPNPPRTAHGEH